MASHNPTPTKCPWCGRIKAVKAIADVFYCTHCRKHFDDEPDEGGDYYSDPSKWIEQHEKPIQRRRR